MTATDETMDTPQDSAAETEQLDTSDLEAVVGGNDPPPVIRADEGDALLEGQASSDGSAPNPGSG